VNVQALANKLDQSQQATLTAEECTFLLTLLSKGRPSIKKQLATTRAQRQALMVSRFYIATRGWFPEAPEKQLIGKVAETFRCSDGTVRHDLRYARRLNRGAWWRKTERDVREGEFAALLAEIRRCQQTVKL
jgi:hypothetical protein